MNGILKWSLAQSAEHPSDDPAQPLTRERREFLNSAFEAASGPSEAQLMKENLQIALDKKSGDDAKSEALLNFRDLVERIDNAMDIDKMKMWPSIAGMLSSKSPIVVQGTLAVIAAATNNNPSSQSACLNASPKILKEIVTVLAKAKTPKVRANAVSALSGLLKHNASAVAALDDASWKVIDQSLRGELLDSDPQVRRRLTFALDALLLPEKTVMHLPPEALGKNMHVPSQTNAPKKVFDNSHAALISDPSRVATSVIVLPRMENLITTVADRLRKDDDSQVIDHLLRLLYTYVVLSNKSLKPEDSVKVANFLKSNSKANLDLDQYERKQLLDRV